MSTIKFNKSTDVSVFSPSSSHKPKSRLPVITSFLADASGCSFIRLVEPLMNLEYGGKAMVNLSHMMEYNKTFFEMSDVVILQRQGEQHQLEYFKQIKHLQQILLNQKGRAFKIMFEVDDIFTINVKGNDGRIYPGIPDYNAAKMSFNDPSHDERVKEIVNLCDEFVVCSPFMKQTYKDTFEFNKITAFPNLISRRWAGNFYNSSKVLQNYEENKKKPRICWQGSPTHLKLIGKVEKKEDLYDDFIHIGKVIIDTLDKYQWVLFGGCPLYLREYVKSGQIEYHDWVNIMDFPRKISELNAQVFIAPIASNHFSFSKSWQKLLDSWVHGIPCVAQDAPPYVDARYKFKSGDEMISQIDSILSGNYSDISKESRNRAEALFVENYKDEYLKLYTTPYGDPSRKDTKFISSWNSEQVAN